MELHARRDQNLELVRIFSALGIVVFHAGAQGAEIGYGGLIAFAAMSLMFATNNEGAPRTTARLAKSLIVPWLFWSFLYGLLNTILKGYILPPGLGLVSATLLGTSQHLWYLPFIFVVLAIFERLKGVSGGTFVIAGLGLAGIAMLIFAGYWRPPSLELTRPLPQFVHAVPAVVIGAAAGIGIRLSGRFRAVMLLLLATVAAGWSQQQGIVWPYISGLGAIALALILPRMKLNVEPASRCMFGVYLVHIAALGVFNRVFGEGQWSTVVCAFLAATAGVYVVRRAFPPSRHVLG